VKQGELERGILDARDKGDVATLERLQERYRSEHSVTRISRGPVCLVERSAPTRAPEASPEPETGTLPSVVRLRPEAYATIQNWPHALGFECGGFMVGYESDGEVVVECVFGADGANPVGEANRLVLNTGEWLAAVNERVGRAGWRVVGDIHTHPRGEPQLSGTDERGLQAGADVMKQTWIGIVVGRDPERLAWGATDWLWVRPEIRGYLAAHGGCRVIPIDVTVERGAEC
jgi:proteasome lid subunit RPN8/RPN11